MACFNVLDPDFLDNLDLDFDSYFDEKCPPPYLPGYDPALSRKICEPFLNGQCRKGNACPYRHSTKSDKVVVCKHYLRGLCKKGEDCEYLHEYDLSRMPECYFWSKFGECSNPDCLYRHIDADEKQNDCPWYLRGFCKHGPKCRLRHLRKVMCVNYMAGFCPLGSKCSLGHPKFEVSQEDEDIQRRSYALTCHKCGEVGHKATFCPNKALTSWEQTQLDKAQQQF